MTICFKRGLRQLVVVLSDAEFQDYATFRMASGGRGWVRGLVAWNKVAKVRGMNKHAASLSLYRLRVARQRTGCSLWVAVAYFMYPRLLGGFVVMGKRNWPGFFSDKARLERRQILEHLAEINGRRVIADGPDHP